MAPVVQHLPTKYEVLSSSSSTTKKERERKERREREREREREKREREKREKERKEEKERKKEGRKKGNISVSLRAWLKQYKTKQTRSASSRSQQMMKEQRDE
jgi:hypothetical protein